MATIHLIGVGKVLAVPASELVAGDRLMWNYGSVYTVVSVEDVSPKFIAIMERDKDGKDWGPRRLKKDRLVARMEPASPFVMDPANPTDAELTAAIQRGLATGQLITAEQFMAEVEADEDDAAGPITHVREFANCGVCLTRQPVAGMTKAGREFVCSECSPADVAAAGAVEAQARAPKPTRSVRTIDTHDAGETLVRQGLAADLADAFGVLEAIKGSTAPTNIGRAQNSNGTLSLSYAGGDRWTLALTITWAAPKLPGCLCADPAKPSPLCPVCDHVTRARFTVTHPNGITQVFRSTIADRAAGESAIGAFWAYRTTNLGELVRIEYRTCTVDGSSLGVFGTEAAAFAAVRANDGRYRLEGRRAE